MNILIADSEACGLSSLRAAVQMLFPAAQLHCAASELQAREWAETLRQDGGRLDYLFCETVTETLDGLSLARCIRQHHPQVKILFCTDCRDHALAAMSLYARGYLLKPVTADAIAQTLDAMVEDWRTQREGCGTLQVRTFGYFEVFAEGKRLAFKREKAKELLAVLVDRSGAGMTAKEICAVLFPEDSDETKNIAYLRQLVLDLKNTLRSVQAEDVLQHDTPYYRIDTNLVRCDYFSFLETGKPGFYGEYMTQYSWAEETCALLQFKE